MTYEPEVDLMLVRGHLQGDVFVDFGYTNPNNPQPPRVVRKYRGRTRRYYHDELAEMCARWRGDLG